MEKNTQVNPLGTETTLYDAHGDLAARAASEIKALNDLELVLASGGDTIPSWG